MSRSKRFSVVTGLVLVFLILSQAGGSAAGSPQGEGPNLDPEAVTAPTTMFYQGYVTVSGSPYNGTGYFKFIITNAAANTTYWSNNGSSSGGSQPSAAVPLAVTDGYFSVLLGNTALSGMTQALGANVFSAAGRYLKVWFATTSGGTYTALSPVPIGSAPYALNAETLDGVDGAAFSLASHNHWGASWSGSGVGLTLASSNNSALFARSGSANSYTDFMGVVEADSTGLMGVIGDSGSTIGVLGRSNTANGVVGQSWGGASGGTGVWGYSNSTAAGNAGTRGHGAGTAYGVYGRADANYAVYADSDSTDYNIYGVYARGPQGLYAISEASSSDAITAQCTAGGNCFGLDSYSETSYGIYVDTGRADQNYGLYTPDKIYSLNYHAAQGIALIAQNGGDTPLQLGDLVAVSGLGKPLPDSSTPVLSVKRAAESSAGEVVGVVQSAFRIELVNRPKVVYKEADGPKDPITGELGDKVWVSKAVDAQFPMQVPVEGPAQPGDFLVIQVQGLAQVRVSAGAGTIQVGDLLTAGPQGEAQRAEPALGLDGRTLEYTAGTLLGKALEAWDGGDGLIWVLIDLR